MERRDKGDKFFVAIDIGTSTSGYAYSVDGKNVYMNKNWTGGHEAYKAPTCVLLKGCEFEAFGFEAIDKYLERPKEETSTRHLYRNFKLQLHTTTRVTEKTTVSSDDGHVTPVIDLFVHVLGYLAGHALNLLNQQLKENAPKPEQIKWILTIPAICSEQSKKFMRLAAYRSKLIQSAESNQLVIALEPEAASICCQKEKGLDGRLSNGIKYLTLDCGGGTNDMVIHEIVRNRAKEISFISGGTHGGTRVDEQFILLLEEIFGKSFIDSYKSKNGRGWCKLLERFEILKRKVTPDTENYSIEIPASMVECFKKVYPKTDFEKSFQSIEGVEFDSEDKELIIAQSVIQSFYKGTIEKIVAGIKDALSKPDNRQLNYILMVGGFCENEYLVKAITHEFESERLKIISPVAAQLAIVKGAVLYGFKSDQIISRIARKTYGVICKRRFDPIKHDRRKKMQVRGREYCTVCEPLVLQGERVEYNSVSTFNGVMRADSTKLRIRFFSLDREPDKQEVIYEDSADVFEIGDGISVSRPDEDLDQELKLQVNFIFGDTEIRAQVINPKNNEILTAKFEFLSSDPKPSIYPS